MKQVIVNLFLKQIIKIPFFMLRLLNSQSPFNTLTYWATWMIYMSTTPWKLIFHGCFVFFVKLNDTNILNTYMQMKFNLLLTALRKLEVKYIKIKQFFMSYSTTRNLWLGCKTQKFTEHLMISQFIRKIVWLKSCVLYC